MIITPKQQEVIDAMASGDYDDIFLIGPLGTSKTYVEAFALISLCYEYPNSMVAVARTTLADVKKGTLHSYLEVLEDMHMVEGKHYRMVGGFSGNEIFLKFANKSILQFVALDYTKDREWKGPKSMNITAAGFDEVDAIRREGYIALSSRVGRRNKNGAPAVNLSTCNPNETWVKEFIYSPWKKGLLPKRTKVIEFTMVDSYLYESGFYDRYQDNPEQWKERYLHNNWDYLDDDTSLFKTRILDRIMTAKQPDDDNQFLGVDVADEGKDRTVMTHIKDGVIFNIVIYSKDDIERLATPEEKKNGVPYGHVVGREMMKYCIKNGIGYSNTAFDAVGIGTSLRDYLISQNFYSKEFKAGAKPEGDYDMLRSEMGKELSDDMDNNKLKIYEGCPHVAEMKNELLYHQYEVKDKVFCLESKKKLKLRLGKSPDIADSVFIAYWAKVRSVVGSFGKVEKLSPEVIERIEEENKPITAGLINKVF